MNLEKEQAKSFKTLWRNHDYLLLWIGESISDLGTGISQVAFPVLVLILTNSPATAGLIFSVGQLPYILFGLLAGALVDYWDRKRIMLFCAAGLALCLAGVALVVLSGLSISIQIASFFVFSFLIGTLTVFYGLAALATLTQVVPKHQLPRALSQNEAAYSTISLTAPPIGTFLLSIGRLLPFVVDSISYLVLFLSIFFMRTSFQEERKDRKVSLLKDIRTGLHWVWQQHVVRFLIVLAGYLDVMVRINVLLVPVIAHNAGLPLRLVGIILAAAGLGNILSVVVSPLLQRRFAMGKVLISTLMLLALLWPVYALATNPWSLGAIIASLACVDSIAYQHIINYRLSVVPDQLQGRVGSIARLILFGCTTIGPAVVGICLQRIGIVPTIGGVWAGFIFFMFLAIFNRQLRQAALSRR